MYNTAQKYNLQGLPRDDEGGGTSNFASVLPYLHDKFKRVKVNQVASQ
jgi:hypothetical protein